MKRPPKVGPPKSPTPPTLRKTGIRYRLPSGEWKEYIALGKTRRGVGVESAAPAKPKFDFGETPKEKTTRLAQIKAWQKDVAAARARDREKRKAKTPQPVHRGRQRTDTSRFGEFRVR